MGLFAIQILLLLLALLHSPAVLVGVAENVPTNDDSLTLQGGDSQQPILQFGQPSIPFIGQLPLTSDRLIDLVNRTFLVNHPSRILPQSLLDGVVGELHWHGKKQPLTDVFQVDVRVPWINTCRPVVRGTKRLHQGIVCGNSPCSIRVSFSVATNYQTTESLRVETTISVGAAYKGIEASVSTTRERFWEKIWGRQDESTVEYEWNLDPGQNCVPSMAHVELECDVDYYTVHYDTQYRRPQDRTRLEYDMNRKASWNGNQWCFAQYVRDPPLRRNENWHEVLPNDGHNQGNRGDIWKLPAPEMNQYRLGVGAFGPTQIVIRRQRGSGGDGDEVFRCTRNPSTRRQATITVPLSADNNALEGFVGCVTSG
ncbi:MAG: hypothetical protein L6R40_000243 [Gallowayella cf. fulva]|nr:MAG: hypothetical protein L6R40_000243 [Xanthomendoza cf. fulva]